MASSPSIEPTGHQVAMAIIKSCNDFSVDSFMSYRAPNCIHQVVPSSLSRPPMTNAVFSAYILSLQPHFRNVHVTVHDVLEDSQTRKVCIWATCTAETDVGPFVIEIMSVAYLNAEGEVEKLVEFVDTEHTLSFFGRFREFLAEKKRGMLRTRM